MNDKKVKAVVLRIDSPGGDPVACDMITRSVQRLQAAGKPVVAQMSSVAASGGMWIASQCTRITCSPLTLTGSIGVIAGSVSFGEMLRRYAITKDSYTTHESSTPAMPYVLYPLFCRCSLTKYTHTQLVRRLERLATRYFESHD